jgi:N4-gp56 family major capsid protein
MSSVINYGDISPRTAAYAIKDMLKRGMPYLCIEKFGQTYPIPTNATKVAKFRRYFLSGTTGAAGAGTASGSSGGANPAYYVPLATTALVEGVTPSGRNLANQDYTVTLAQYGDYTTITDVVMDTHEDPVLQQATEILGEQAALTVETLRFNVLKAGTNAFYAAGTTGQVTTVRTSVIGPINRELQRKITTALTRQNARPITQVVSSTPNFRTEPVEAAFIGLVHPDCESDIRNMNGFISTKQYGTVTPFENEIGSVERVRYLSSTVFAPWVDAGAATSGGTTYRSTTGTLWDVYPILFLARDAYGIVPLKGKDSLTPMVVNPKPAAGDPLAQRGTVGWKTMQASVILNEAWMARAEVTATS